MQGEGKCTKTPYTNSGAWDFIPGDSADWTYDSATESWETVITNQAISPLPVGTYLLHYYDFNSGLKSATAVNLVN